MPLQVIYPEPTSWRRYSWVKRGRVFVGGDCDDPATWWHTCKRGNTVFQLRQIGSCTRCGCVLWRLEQAREVDPLEVEFG